MQPLATTGRKLTGVVVCLRVVALASLLQLATAGLEGAPAAAQLRGPEFVRTVGAAAPPGLLNEPLGVAAAPDGRIFVVDHGNARIQVFNSMGLPIHTWGTRGSGSGQFYDPTDVAVTPDGHYLYVVDRGLYKVKRFRIDQECFESPQRDCFSGGAVLAWGYRGRGPGGFMQPTGIGIDRHGNVYVSDWKANEVHKFSPDGVFLSRIGAPGTEVGQLLRPTAVEVDRQDRVWVADRDNNRIARFWSDGTPDGVWTNGGKFHRPTGLALDPDGGGIVRDYDPQYRLPRVWRFNANLEIVDGPRTLGCESLDDSFPFQGASVLEGGGAVLTDANSAEMSLFMIAPEGEVVNLARRCRAPEHLDRPVAVALDQDHFIVAEAGSDQVTLIDPRDGDRPVRVFERPEYEFGLASGVAVQRFGPTLPEAVIYVADAQRHMVVLIGPDGARLGTWGDGTPRVGGDGLRGPQAVAVSPNGDVFIADTLNHRIVHRAAYGDGSVVRIITGSDCPKDQGELQFPVAVAVGADGTLYTLERNRNRLRAFSSEGSCLGLAADGPNSVPAGDVEIPAGILWRPVALAADDRYLYVLENDGDQHVRVQVFAPQPDRRPQMRVVAVFAEAMGPGPGELWQPSGIAAADGRLLIADTANHRLQFYRWPGTEPTAQPTERPTQTPLPTATATRTERPTALPEPSTATPTVTLPPPLPTASAPPPLDSPTRRVVPPGRAYVPVLLRH